MGKVDDRLAELGLTLPPAPVPAANYVPFVRTGNLVFIAGQVPSRDGEFLYVGQVGSDFTVEQAQGAAKMCGLAMLAQLQNALDGDLDRVRRVVKLNGFVSCVPGFGHQPHVINAASDLMVSIWGEKGRHARAAVGVAGLPFGVAVEIDGVFEVE